MTTTPRLGPSQQAVYDYIKTHGPSTGQQVGNALYDKTSEWGKRAASNRVWSFSPTDKHRRDWANKALRGLAQKGLLEILDEGPGNTKRVFGIPKNPQDTPAARHHSPFAPGASPAS